MLSPWTFDVERIDPGQCSYSTLLTTSTIPISQLEHELEDLVPTQCGKSTKSGFSDLPYPLITRDYSGYLLSFDGSIKKPEHGGYGSCGFVI
jgi:hypothetical protein